MTQVTYAAYAACITCVTCVVCVTYAACAACVSCVTAGALEVEVEDDAALEEGSRYMCTYLTLLPLQGALEVEVEDDAGFEEGEGHEERAEVTEVFDPEQLAAVGHHVGDAARQST